MLKALVLIGGFQAAAIAVTVVRSKLISVTLGPEGLGVTGTIDQFLSVVLVLSSLSLPAIATRLLPRTHGVDPEGFRRQYANFITAVLVASAVGTVIVAVVVQTVPRLLGHELADYRFEITIALASVPLMALGLLLPNVLAASQRHTMAAVLYFAIAAASAAAAWIGSQIGGIREIYIVQAAALAICLGVTLGYLWIRVDLPCVGRSGALKQLLRDNPDLVSTAIVAYITLLGTAVALFVVRSVMLTAQGAETAGLLQGLLSVGLSVGAVLSAMSGRYLGPLLNRRTEQVDKAVVTELFRRWQLMLLTVLSVPLAMFAELTLTLLFSSRFTAAGPWLPTFLGWQLVTLQVAIQIQLFFALDDLKPVATIAIAGNALAIAVCFAAVPRFGLTGAAAALLAGALLMNAAGAHRLRRQHGIAPQRRSRLLTTYVVLSLVIMPYLLRLLDPAGAAAALRIGVCAVLVSGLWLFLDAGERHQLTSRLRRRAA